MIKEMLFEIIAFFIIQFLLIIFILLIIYWISAQIGETVFDESDDPDSG